MLGIQIVALVFGTFMLYLTFLHLKRNEFNLFEATTWFMLWFVISFVAISPNSLDFLVKEILSLQRPLDFFMICGFLFFIFITFYNCSKINKNEKKIEKIVSNLSINSINDSNEKFTEGNVIASDKK